MPKPRKVFSDEENEFLRANIHVMKKTELCDRLHVKFETLRKQAEKLNLDWAHIPKEITKYIPKSKMTLTDQQLKYYEANKYQISITKIAKHLGINYSTFKGIVKRLESSEALIKQKEKPKHKCEDCWIGRQVTETAYMCPFPSCAKDRLSLKRGAVV